MPSKSYTCVRAWRYVDPRTGEPTDYTPGDPYEGDATANPFLLDPAGPDGCGPLIAEKTADKAVVAKPAPAPKEN